MPIHAPLPRRTASWLSAALVVVAAGLHPAHGASSGAPEAALSHQATQLLAARCLECHSGPEPKGGLDLSRRSHALQGGKTAPAIVPGQATKSLLWEQVSQDDMPPKKPLPAAEKELLRRWLDAGAPYAQDPIDPFRSTSEVRAGYDWWSLQPLQRHTPPAVRNTNWPQNTIDTFILHRLEQEGIAPSPPAPPRVQLRRLFFDLTGLPPSPEEVAAFERDPSDASYARWVDRLLASPQYGERWGRHWLDVVRYGESDGFERNAPRTNAWPYRDWVIGALNSDLPYDAFVRHQLAGDLIDPDPVRGAAASGFLVAGLHNTVVGGSDRMQKLARQDELEEIAGTIGQTFLGLTINCGRCHDHKFDPLTSRDYYRFVAALDGIQHGERELPNAAVAAELATVETTRAALDTRLAQLEAIGRERVLAARRKSRSPPPPGPRPLAEWTFESGGRDGIGHLHGEVIGGARLEGGALVLEGATGYFRTAPLERDLAEKTLEALVILDDLNQGGGAALSVQSRDGRFFDAIVFGEREPRRWMAGSDGFTRTQSFGGTEETDTGRPVHVAIVYRRDGSITGYRNGHPYGRAYTSGLHTFQAGETEVLIGLRHSPPGGNRLLKGRVLQAALHDQALSPEAVAARAGQPSDYVAEEALLATFEPSQRSQWTAWTTERAALRERLVQLQATSKRRVYTVQPGKPGSMRIHRRGSVTDLGEVVTPGGVAALRTLDADFGLAADAADPERRLRLANWITSPDNPLFLRTLVNRVWHYHFGAGIVETPNDLGFNGGRPSHPELLDWLVDRLQQEGLRLKPLHRLIVLSATYRQASTPNPAAMARDTGNRWLWRRTPQRLEGEALRDALLQVAGRLNPVGGGPGYDDVLSEFNSGTTYYTPIDRDDPRLDRRTVYRFSPRGGRSTLLDTFDCPDPSATAPRRTVTTTPLQALSLLNNPFALRMSAAFAQRLERECGPSPEAQVSRAYRLAYDRDPGPAELAAALPLAHRHGLPALCRALLNSNEFVILE